MQSNRTGMASMQNACRFIAAGLSVAALAFVLSAGAALAQNHGVGNGNGNGNDKHGAPGPVIGDGLEGLALIGGAVYWIRRRSRRSGC
jgi:hypothetical protein